MAEYTIPDDVWEKRCCWCTHRQTEENCAIPSELIHSNRIVTPCRIMGVISREWRFPGECESFVPTWIYGICATCKHDNIFMPDYCELDEQPNKRQLFIGQGYKEPDYWAKHRLSVCDNYEPDLNFKDEMIWQAAEGRAPRNFDPETMQPTDQLEPTKWAGYEQKIAEEKEQAERELTRRDAERSGQIPGQIKMEF